MVRINDGSVNFNIYLLLHIAIFVGFETNHNYIYKTKNTIENTLANENVL